MFFLFTHSSFFQIHVIFPFPCSIEETENSYTVYIILNGLFSNPTPSFISQILYCLLHKTCKYLFQWLYLMLITICLYFMLIENYSCEWSLPDILMRNVTYVTYIYE